MPIARILPQPLSRIALFAFVTTRYTYGANPPVVHVAAWRTQPAGSLKYGGSIQPF
ncbi:hypothetical protein [[Pantoea] beijingensis]|uniref:hypothetical protein n=1 Tax=[Pantoea] beijingensis TaxID=1324864 RepID=UPI0012AF1350|nr:MULTISPECIES: hypothetical protein [Erwiniaceae]